ncbi:hypothetical protein Tco_1034251 [Tanacetum coccineum]
MSNDDDVPSWGIPLMDAYESDPEAPEAALQSPDQAPLSPAHAPVYPEYLAPFDDDLEPAEAQPLPASISPTVLSPYYLADSKPVEEDPKEDLEEDPEEEPSEEEEEELLALADSPSAGLYIDLPSERFEIGDSSAAAAAGQPESTLARGTDYGFMIALKEVNGRVTDLATSHRHDSEEFYERHQDAQDDRQARVSSLERQRRYHHTMAIVAERDATQDDGDKWTKAIGRIQELEHSREPERCDGLADASSSC